MEPHSIDELAAEVEQKFGSKVSERKRKFALLKMTNPGKSNAELARQVGAKPISAKQTGYALSNDPQVLALQEKLQGLQQYSSVEIDPKLIKSGLLREALNADLSRDRKGAWDSLAKTEGMFKDVVEHREMRPDEEFLADIEKEFGKDVRIQVAEELGL